LTGIGLHLEQNGPVGVVTLDRPPVNAVTFALLDALAGAVSDPAAWAPDARSLVITSRGEHFSAGMDRSVLARLDRGSLIRAAGALDRVLHSPLPIVSAVRGVAAGTGFIIAACADLMVIHPESTVWLPEVELGMLGGAGHALRWLPVAYVRRMVLKSERVEGVVLHRFGALGPPPGASVEETAIEVATRLAMFDPEVMSEARSALAGLEHDASTVHRAEMQNTPIPPFHKEEDRR
jgi:enoyl-CoA hydratase